MSVVISTTAIVSIVLFPIAGNREVSLRVPKAAKNGRLAFFRKESGTQAGEVVVIFLHRKYTAGRNSDNYWVPD